MEITELLRLCLMKGHEWTFQVSIAQCDVKKAFDSITHEAIWAALEHQSQWGAGQPGQAAEPPRQPRLGPAQAKDSLEHQRERPAAEEVVGRLAWSSS